MKSFAKIILGIVLAGVGFGVGGCVVDDGYVSGGGVYYGGGPGPWFYGGYGHPWHHGGYEFRPYR